MAQATVSSDRIDSPARPQRRRRRIVVLTMLCLLLAVVGSIVWHINRPLSDVEQRLVGTWGTTAGPSVFTFDANRTVTARGYPVGRWFVQEDRLYWWDSYFEEATMRLLRPEIDRSYVLTFEDDDSISVFVPVNGSTHQWQRVEPQ